MAPHHQTAALDAAGASLGDLIDRLGRLRARQAELDMKEKRLKAAIVDRGIAEGEGCLYRMTVVSASRSVVDLARLRAELGADFLAERSKTTVTTSIRTALRTEAVAKLAEAA
jgi:hypothetical protein